MRAVEIVRRAPGDAPKRNDWRRASNERCQPALADVAAQTTATHYRTAAVVRARSSELANGGWRIMYPARNLSYAVGAAAASGGSRASRAIWALALTVTELRHEGIGGET